MSRSNTVIVNGKEVLLIEASKLIGISRTSIYRYVKANDVTYQDAIDYFIDKRNDSIIKDKHIVYGKAVTLYEACVIIECKKESILLRSKYTNTSVQDVLDEMITLKGDKKCAFNYDGKTYYTDSKFNDYISYKDIASIVGIKYSTLMSSINKFDSLNECIEFCLERERIKQEQRFSVFVDGKEFNTVRSLSDFLGIHTCTIANRIRRSNKSAQEVVDDLIRHGVRKSIEKKKVVLDGVEYNSIREAAESVYWTYNTVTVRATLNGTSVEDELLNRMNKVKNGLLSSIEVSSICKDELHAIRYAYTGRSGVNYFYCACNCCGKKLLVSCIDIIKFEHSDKFCTEHEMGYSIYC